MAVKESRFNERLRRELAQFGFRFYRVESHGTCPGIPDNHFIQQLLNGDSICGWIEIKEESKYPSKVKYRPAQPAWLVEYSKLGGRCGTVVHILEDDNLLLIPGKESLRAASNLGATHHVQRVDLGEAGDWERVVRWLVL